jgi:hypothetical protein
MFGVNPTIFATALDIVQVVLLRTLGFLWLTQNFSQNFTIWAIEEWHDLAYFALIQKFKSEC